MAKKFVVVVFSGSSPLGSFANDTAEQAKTAAAGQVKNYQNNGYHSIELGFYELQETGSIPPAVQVNWTK